MVESSTSRFQMVGARSAILEGPITEPIEQQIEAIENALESIPDFAFDLSKTLVESVCKTVLADIGQPADPNWNAPKLLKETANRLNLLPRNHPDPAKASESVEKTIRGMIQTIQGLCELRNNYGMASHGRDAFAARLELRQATLAAQAADTIVSFLYRIHRGRLDHPRRAHEGEAGAPRPALGAGACDPARRTATERWHRPRVLQSARDATLRHDAVKIDQRTRHRRCAAWVPVELSGLGGGANEHAS